MCANDLLAKCNSQLMKMQSISYSMIEVQSLVATECSTNALNDGVLSLLSCVALANHLARQQIAMGCLSLQQRAERNELHQTTTSQISIGTPAEAHELSADSLGDFQMPQRERPYS